MPTGSDRASKIRMARGLGSEGVGFGVWDHLGGQTEDGRAETKEKKGTERSQIKSGVC